MNLTLTTITRSRSALTYKPQCHTSTECIDRFTDSFDEAVFNIILMDYIDFINAPILSNFTDFTYEPSRTIWGVYPLPGLTSLKVTLAYS